MRLTQIRIVAIGLITVGHSILAQQPRDSLSGSVTGIAYDSLRGQPLRGALIGVTSLGKGEPSQSATTDSTGHFAIAHLGQGDYRLTLLDPHLDSLGLPSPSARVRVAPQQRIEGVMLAIPSFEHFWNLACHTTPPAPDTGLIFGTVISGIDRAGASQARISVQWEEIAFDKPRGLTSRRWSVDTRSGEGGDYAVCGVPIDTPLRLAARKDNLSTGQLPLNAGDGRLIRRDVTLGRADGTGVLLGFVHFSFGTSHRIAHVGVDGARETETDSMGRFSLVGLPTGSRELTVTAIGASPISRIVDIVDGDTNAITVELERFTTLESVNVVASSAWRANILAEIADRRRLGFGTFMDSTSLARYGILNEAVQMLWSKGFCAIYIDGQAAGLADLRDRQPRDIALVEVLRGFEAPDRFRGRTGACVRGILLVWTKKAAS